MANIFYSPNLHIQNISRKVMMRRHVAFDDGYEKHVENGGAHSHHCEHKNAF